MKDFMNDNDIFIGKTSTKPIIQLEIFVNCILFEVNNGLNLTKTQIYALMTAIWLFGRAANLQIECNKMATSNI